MLVMKSVNKNNVTKTTHFRSFHIFSRQRIPESGCAMKETVNTGTLITPKTGEKNHATYQNNKWTCHKMRT